jgi:hypothetical protein
MATNMIVAELKDSEGKLIGMITASAKDFKTGSKGFYGNGKLEVDGKRYQTSVQLVEIGSKPKVESK